MAVLNPCPRPAGSMDSSPVGVAGAGAKPQTQTFVGTQVDREVQKAMALLEEVGGEVSRKKEASGRVKALRGELAGVQHDMDEVEAQLRTLRAKSERLALWTRQHQHQVCLSHACCQLPHSRLDTNSMCRLVLASQGWAVGPCPTHPTLLQCIWLHAVAS